VPSDPLETLREGYTAFNRDDVSWPFLRCAEDVEWGTPGLFPGMKDVYRGHQGVVEWMRTIRAEWEQFEVSLLEVMRQKPDALAVGEGVWGRGRESGAEGRMSFHGVYRLTPEGRIASRTVYRSREEALAAL
jgi:ketosteroid isomerase-like protein